MEIIDGNSGLMTNYEVYTHLRHNSQYPSLEVFTAAVTQSRLRSEDKTNTDRPSAYAIHRDLIPLAQTVYVQQKVLDYIRTQPAHEQTAEQIKSFTAAIVDWQQQQQHSRSPQSQHPPAALTSAEILTLINQRPVTVVELHRIIDECEERLNESETIALLDLVKKHFPNTTSAAAET